MFRKTIQKKTLGTGFRHNQLEQTTRIHNLDVHTKLYVFEHTQGHTGEGPRVRSKTNEGMRFMRSFKSLNKEKEEKN